MATLTNFQAIISQAGGGVPSLSSILVIGNETGGTDIIVSSSDRIQGEDNGAGPGFNLLLDGGDAGGAGPDDGGDLILSPGLGVGGGDPGIINLNGDTEVAGDLTVSGNLILANLISGAGSPETSVVADIGAIYQRTDGGSGNAWYIKSASSGGNTGWVPGGPRVLDEFTAAPAQVIFTTGRPFFESASLSMQVFVTLNGIRMRKGAGEDYQVTGAGPPFSEITFNFTPTTGDFVAIEYLPA